MLNSTTNTYTLKREILSFSNKISRKLSKPDKKFTADMTYGLLASGSCLLTDVVDQLHEASKKVNSVVLWSSFFVTLVAKKMIGLLLRGYWSCQLLSRVLRTACAAYP